MTRKNVYGNATPCFHCESTASEHIKKGRDESDTYSLRLRRCRECGENFTTAEATIGDGRVYWDLDYVSRQQWADAWRKQNPTAMRKARRKKPILHLVMEWSFSKIRRAA
jgi:transcriptional regulator NrdR family protein